jgi:hypothetical protein
MNGDRVGIKAAGIYLEEVREGQHLSRLDAANRAAIVRDENYVWKVERARIQCECDVSSRPDKCGAGEL